MRWRPGRTPRTASSSDLAGGDLVLGGRGEDAHVHGERVDGAADGLADHRGAGLGVAGQLAEPVPQRRDLRLAEQALAVEAGLGQHEQRHPAEVLLLQHRGQVRGDLVGRAAAGHPVEHQRDGGARGCGRCAACPRARRRRSGRRS